MTLVGLDRISFPSFEVESRPAVGSKLEGKRALYEEGGDVIIYTGHGGQDKLSRQCAHQKLEGGNLVLERSMYYGIEVRVIRGKKISSLVSQKVYVYDGLYRVLETWLDVGKSGFGVFKFKLVRMEGQPEMGSAVLKFAECEGDAVECEAEGLS